MIGSRKPDEREAEAARITAATLIAFLRNDERTAPDANLLGEELAALNLDGDQLFGVVLQTSAAIIDAICKATKTDAVGSVRALMALIGANLK